MQNNPPTDSHLGDGIKNEIHAGNTHAVWHECQVYNPSLVRRGFSKSVFPEVRIPRSCQAQFGYLDPPGPFDDFDAERFHRPECVIPSKVNFSPVS
jgi:hypothetical protein